MENESHAFNYSYPNSMRFREKNKTSWGGIVVCIIIPPWEIPFERQAEPWSDVSLNSIQCKCSLSDL